MELKTINSDQLAQGFLAGAKFLQAEEDKINELNVFPVPDGDTGINMSMTSDSGVAEVEKCESDSIIDLAKIFARGLLMGARGNSGVSLSQYFRGLSVAIKNMQKDTLSTDDFITCFQSGRDVAYKAFKDPVEGTMLTVIRESYEGVEGKHFDTFEELFATYYEAAKKSEENTPNLLPVLKEANVTDSGGEGFLVFIEGMYKAICGQMLSKTDELGEENDHSKYEYETKFYLVLNQTNLVVSDLRETLSVHGVVKIEKNDNNTLLINIFTNDLGKVLTLCSQFGSLVQVEVKNNKLQDKLPEVKKDEPLKEIALVSVAFGDGIKETFKELGCSVVINGGQTMNPSTESFVKACEEAHAKNVIIIPNNGNVIMAAEQATKLVENVNVKVLRAKTIAQGYASLMAFDETSDIDTNLADMQEAVSQVKTGEVTYAVRDTSISGVEIKANDFMGILDGNIIVSKKDRVEATKDLLKEAVDEDSAVVTIFKGNGVSDSEAEELQNYISELNEDVECEVIDGKQEIYSYIISVE